MNNNYSKNQGESVQDLADQMLMQLYTNTRDSGETFVSLKDGAPEWMSDLAYAAHNKSMPDDHIWSFIQESLQAIADHNNEDDARDSIDADCYNRDLLDWLGSSLSRAEYVNEAVQEFGMESSDFDLFKSLQIGQLKEKQEIFSNVLSSLEDRLNEVSESVA